MSENVRLDLAKLDRRDNWRDRFLIGIALVLLVCEVLYLLHWLRIIQLPLPWEEKASLWRKIGVVAEKRNVLKNRGDGSLSWFPMGTGEEVHLNDTLLTGPDSTARLEIVSQGEILLESNTLLKFSEGPKTQDGRLNLELVQGLLRVRTKKGALPMHMKSHSLMLGPGTEIVLSRPALMDQSQVQVKAGEAKIIPDEEIGADGKKQAPITLKVGEALQMQTQRALARLETKLAIEPKYPVPQARIFAKGNVETIGIYWDGEEAREVEISREPDFLAPRRLRTSGRSVQADFTPGKYYWRARRDVAVSPALEFTLMPAVQYKLVHPENESAVKEGATVTLKWEPVVGASHYLVEISRTEDFKDYLVQSDVNDVETQLKGIQAGNYFWRVRAVHPEWGPWSASPVHSFQAKRKLSAPKPKGAKVLPGTQSSIWDILSEWILPSAHAAEGETVWVEFEWEALEGAEAYRLEIYGSEDKQELLQILEVDGTQANVELPRRGKYFWRIAAIDESQLRHLFSPLQTVAVAPETMRVPTETEITAKNFFPIEGKKKRVVSPAGDVTAGGGATGDSPSREIASVENSRGVLPNSLAVGAGGQGELESATETDFAARSFGAAQYFSLELDRRGRVGWRLRGDFRRNYLGLEGGTRTEQRRWGVDLLLRALLFGLDVGAVAREDVALIRVAGNASGARNARSYGLQVGRNWESGSGNWRGLFEAVLQGFPLGDFRGAGLVGEAGLGYDGWGALMPEFLLRVSPRLYVASPRTQWTVETLATLRLRIALDKNGRARR